MIPSPLMYATMLGIAIGCMVVFLTAAHLSAMISPVTGF